MRAEIKRLGQAVSIKFLDGSSLEVLGTEARWEEKPEPKPAPDLPQEFRHWLSEQQIPKTVLDAQEQAVSAWKAGEEFAEKKFQEQPTHSHRDGYEDAIRDLFPAADEDPEILAQFMDRYKAPGGTRG